MNKGIDCPRHIVVNHSGNRGYIQPSGGNICADDHHPGYTICIVLAKRFYGLEASPLQKNIRGKNWMRQAIPPGVVTEAQIVNIVIP